MHRRERRQFGRRDSLRHAIVRTPGRPAEPCIIQNISAAGALIEFSQPVWLPYTFELIIDADQFRAHCEWRHSVGNAIGLTFLTNKHDARAKFS